MSLCMRVPDVERVITRDREASSTVLPLPYTNPVTILIFLFNDDEKLRCETTTTKIKIYNNSSKI